MTRLARARVAELACLDLDGYVLKKDSPSCGMERVRVHGGGRPRRDRGERGDRGPRSGGEHRD